MTETELLHAVRKQAEQVNLRFEADLSERVLDDVRGQPGAMPLLQVALEELWKRRHGRWLRASEYPKVGGVREALARMADAFCVAHAARRELLRRIFVLLTRYDDSPDDGAGPRHTRKRLDLDDLVPEGGTREVVEKLVADLATARLVVTSTNPATGKAEAEVAHEELLRSWGTLRDWLRDDEPALVMGRDVERAGEAWESHPGDASYLAHKGHRLQEARAMLLHHPRVRLTDRDRNYLNACTKHELEEKARAELLHRRSRRRLVTGLVAILLGAAVSLWMWWQAEKRADEVQQATADFSVGRGEALCESGDIDQGMHHLLRGLSSSTELTGGAGGWNRRTYHWLRGLLSGTPGAAEEQEMAIRNLLPNWDYDLHRLQAYWHHPEDIWAMTFNDDGSRLATGDISGDLRLWNPDTGAEIGRVCRHGDKIQALAFTKEGWLLSAGDKGGVMVWDTATGTRLGDPVSATGKQSGRVIFSRDGRRCLSLVNDGRELRLWNVDAGRLSLVRTSTHSDRVGCAAFSWDGRFLAIGGESGAVHLLVTDTGEPHRPTKQTGGRVIALAVDPEGETVWINQFYDIALWVKPNMFVDYFALNQIRSDNGVELSRDGRRFLVFEKAEIRVYDQDRFRNNPAGSPLRGEGLHVLGAMSPDGRLVVSLSGGENILDGKLGRVVAGEKQTFRVWRVAKGRPSLTPATSRASVRAIPIFVTDGRIEPALKSLPFLDNLGVVASPPGEELNHAINEAVSKAYERRHVPGSRGVRRYDARPGLLCPDGQTILVGPKDSFDRQQVRLWSLSSNEAVGPSRNHGSIKGIALHPDGRIYLTWGRDGLRLWQTTTGRPCGRAFGEDPWEAAFSADGRQVLALYTRGHKDGPQSAPSWAEGEVRAWQIPRPWEGDAERLKQYVIAATGIDLDNYGEVRRLLPAEWNGLRPLADGLAPR
jgi:WD40 repeat protein